MGQLWDCFRHLLLTQPLPLLVRGVLIHVLVHVGQKLLVRPLAPLAPPLLLVLLVLVVLVVLVVLMTIAVAITR
jgi:hypothetical protein